MKKFIDEILIVTGSIGLVAFSNNFINLQSNINNWVMIYQTISHWVWDSLFGWVSVVSGWELTDWAKDYLTIGLVFAGGFHRTYRPTSQPPEIGELFEIMIGSANRIYWWGLFLTPIFWPIVVLYISFLLGWPPFQQRPSISFPIDFRRTASEFEVKTKYLVSINTSLHKGALVFFKSVIYAFLIIGISYGLMFSGSH